VTVRHQSSNAADLSLLESPHCDSQPFGLFEDLDAGVYSTKFHEAARVRKVLIEDGQVAPRRAVGNIAPRRVDTGGVRPLSPDVELDITTDDSRIDLVAAGFDAGIQFGEFIAQDMVAVRVSPDLRPAIVGAPTYFESHAKPASPRDLLQHRCIRFRHRGESVYKWELDKGNQSLEIAVNGSLILDELELVIQAAIDGAGLAWLAEDRVAEHLSSGALIRVLEDWCPPFPGFFLYYPSRKQQPAALAAVIETFRLSN
jgi:DNA-binding transcriptional LysR family regulator